MGARRLARAGAIVAAAVGLAGFAGTRAVAQSPSANAPQSRCPQPSSGQTAGPSPPSGTAAIQLTPDPGSETLSIAFGSDRTDQVRTLTFSAPQPLTIDPSSVSVYVLGDLHRGATATFPTDQIGFSVSLTPDRTHLVVAVCMDPAQPQPVPQGEYTGLIGLSGTGLQIGSISADVTLRYAASWLAWLIAFAGMALGLLLKTLTDTAKFMSPAPAGGPAPEATETSVWKNVRAYVFSPQFVANVIVGGIIAVAAVFYTFAGNATFGANLGDWLALAAVGFTAMIGGATLTDAGLALRGTMPAPQP